MDIHTYRRVETKAPTAKRMQKCHQPLVSAKIQTPGTPNLARMAGDINSKYVLSVRLLLYKPLPLARRVLQIKSLVRSVPRVMQARHTHSWVR